VGAPPSPVYIAVIFRDLVLLRAVEKPHIPTPQPLHTHTHTHTHKTIMIFIAATLRETEEAVYQNKEEKKNRTES